MNAKKEGSLAVLENVIEAITNNKEENPKAARVNYAKWERDGKFNISLSIYINESQENEKLLALMSADPESYDSAAFEILSIAVIGLHSIMER